MGIYKNFFKRVFDLLFAILLSVILCLPCLLVAFIIKVTSKGPIFFKQKRYGKDSKTFILYKFRSMKVAAPIKSNSEFTNISDYITPFGMLIRKTSIDELPQLINIIKGEMSFIGPRPLAVTDIKVIKLRQQNGGDSVLPGISGLAQVNGRNNLTDVDKAFYDGKYAANVSFPVDVLLTVETVFSVLKRDGVFKDTLIDETNKIKLEGEHSEQKSIDVSSKG